MGLFKKKKKDESEDFILDFGEASATPEGEEQDEEELNITLWDDRKPHRPSHAMTVNEILGNFEKLDKEPESADAPESEPEEQPLQSEQAENSSNEEKASEIAKSSDYERGANFVAPKESEPAVNGGEYHAETDLVPKDINIKVSGSGEKSAAERADELINRLKKENELISAEKSAETAPDDIVDTPKTEPSVAEVPLVEEAENEAVSTTEVNPEDTAEKEEAQKIATPEAPKKPIAEKKETKLSPAAQALYDRMMAERAKQQSARLNHAPISEESPEPTSEETKPEAPEFQPEAEVSLDFKDEDVTVTSDITPEATHEVAHDSIQKTENIADAIFDSLNESFKSDNPLSRKKEQSAASLLSKCKSYVNPAYDIEMSERTIDDIIQSAEQGARERLSNLYDIQDGDTVPVTHHTHEFSPFLQKTTDRPDGKTISIPVKIQDETSSGAVISSTSGDIKNFQYSFADNSAGADEDMGTTRAIDISSRSSGHVTDPVKAQVMKLHLESLAEKEEVPQSEPLKFAAVEEVELPEAEVGKAAAPIPEVEDYKSIEDAESVRTDLAAQQLSIVARLIPTAVIAAILFVVDVFLKESLLASSPTAFTLLNIILLAIALVINHRTLKGFTASINGIPDIDSPTSLGAISVFLYTVIAALMGRIAQAPLLAPAAALILCFNLWGKLSIIKRIRRGFEVIANDGEKKALTFVEDKYSASVMASGGVIGDALICQGKKTKNVSDYLKNAFSEDALEKKLSPVILFTVITAAVFALIAFFVNNGVLPALAAFTAVMCAGCPLSAIFCCNLPLSLVSKKLSTYGAMLAGHSSAEAIANANAVAFDAAELFPKGTIKLYNMQVLESGAVDKYIASASAVLTAAGSPLAPIFQEILETNNEKAPKADSIKYENNMGLSGWIGESRILVGNRTLMEGHNIRTPSLELDKKILRQGYFPLYLACDQQLCALFVIGYEADEEITYELRNLCNTGVTMLVNSNDPNVSQEMLCDYFGLYPDSIKVMTGTGVAAYKTVQDYRESVSAPASYSENISGLLSIVTSSIRMKSIITTLLIIQLALIVLGIALIGYSIFTTGIMALPLLGVLGFQLLGVLITSLAAHLRQP